MPTEVISTLKPSGGDYTSISAWIATLGGTNWTSLDQVPVLECYTGDYSAVGGGTNYIVDNFFLDLELTSKTHPVTIRAAAGHATTGVRYSGLHFRKYLTGAGVIEMTFNGYLRLEGVEVRNTRYTYPAINGTTGSLRVVNCLVEANGGGFVVDVNGDRVDNVFIGCRVWTKDSGTGVWKNATYVNTLVTTAGIGFASTATVADQPIWKNCAAYVPVQAYWSGTQTPAASTNNASNLATTETPGGANPLMTNITLADFTSVTGDDNNDDYTTVSGSILDGSGTSQAGLYLDYNGADDWSALNGVSFSAGSPPIGPYQPGVSITPDDLAHAHLLDPAIALSATPIAPTGIDHVHTLDVAAISVSISLDPDAMDHAHTIDETTLMVSGVVAPNKLDHVHTIDEVSLVAWTALQPNVIEHNHTLDDGVITSSGSLSPGGVDHVHTMDHVSLSAHNAIDPGKINHAHAISHATVFSSASIQPAPIGHVHVLDDGSLIVSGAIVVDGSSHVQTLGEPGLSAWTGMQPDGLDHEHTLDDGALSPATAISPDAIDHIHTLDDSGIVIGYVIPQDMYHTHTIDLATLDGGTVVYSVRSRYLIDAARRRYLIH